VCKTVLPAQLREQQVTCSKSHAASHTRPCKRAREEAALAPNRPLPVLPVLLLRTGNWNCGCWLGLGPTWRQLKLRSLEREVSRAKISWLDSEQRTTTNKKKRNCNSRRADIHHLRLHIINFGHRVALWRTSVAHNRLAVAPQWHHSIGAKKMQLSAQWLCEAKIIISLAHFRPTEGSQGGTSCCCRHTATLEHCITASLELLATVCN